MKKDQGWVMKESNFCGFFPQDGISKTVIAFGVESGARGRCGATQEQACQELLLPAQLGQGVGFYLFASGLPWYLFA